MIRKFNYTSRAKLKRENISINIFKDVNGKPMFSAELQLQNYDFPGNAKIYVEVYRRTAYQRFDFGTIAERTPVISRSLANFQHIDRIFFRVKIVDESESHGQIIANADQITAKTPKSSEVERISLLHVDFQDLGDEVWQLQPLDDCDWPLILLNNRIEGIAEIARRDQHFISLVYPNVVEQVLCYIVITLGVDDLEEDTDGEWIPLWLKFAFNLTGPVTQDDPDSWVKKAVGAICSYQRIRERFERVHRGGIDA
jgi:hypothetical protein